ncbi:hypothetical protein ACFPFX_37730 [Streptomyces mauvecolor]|uniref:Uncharacterized protein n=1 Tax=Streptomyces mauvecolor TaxID=58345 RepID=A0ABV9UXY1_9ACTN
MSAVHDGRQWRVSILLDRFVPEADLPSLMALRQALANDVARQHPC